MTADVSAGFGWTAPGKPAGNTRNGLRTTMKLAARALTPARALPRACADSDYYRHVGRLEETSIPSIGRCGSCGRVVGR